MILEKIAEGTRERVAKKKQVLPFEEIRRLAEVAKTPKDYPFYQAMKKPGISFICEVKKASPSKGVIAKEFPYLSIAKDYEEAGASAISVLTEPEFFLGSDRYLEEISKEISLPLLRKDFIVDLYQVYEAKLMGASALLLIAELHTQETLREYQELARELGLSVLTEAHKEDEVEKAVESGADIIGINNRDLKTFQVDVGTTLRLAPLVPKDRLLITESGILTEEDMIALRPARVDGVLIGEAFMKSTEKKELLSRLRESGTYG